MGCGVMDESGGGGDNPTVKDVLASLAGRMRSQQLKLSPRQPAAAVVGHDGDQSMSRYSVTDYFNSYPPVAPVPPPVPPPAGHLPAASSQRIDFRGTSLDTSMSTIGELAPAPAPAADTDRSDGSSNLSATLSSTLSSSVASAMSSTVASAMSMDDREFRDGLAHLDANIAGIQRTLHDAMKR